MREEITAILHLVRGISALHKAGFVHRDIKVQCVYVCMHVCMHACMFVAFLHCIRLGLYIET